MSQGVAMPTIEALKRVKPLLVRLKPLHPVIAGSARRRKPTVHDIDILVVGNGSLHQTLLELLEDLPVKFSGGDCKLKLKINGVPVDILNTRPESWGAALLYLTGSPGFNIRQRALAKRKGLLLNEKGLWRDGHMVAGRTEREVFKALGMRYRYPWERD